MKNFDDKSVVRDKGLNEAFQSSVAESRREESTWFELFLHITDTDEVYEEQRWTCITVEHLTQTLATAVGIARARSDVKSWGIAVRPYEKDEANRGTLSAGSIPELPQEASHGNED